MSKVYRTAMGAPVDMDMLRLSNETAIAVGNMRVNARGDELGKGGKIVRTRSQVMKEYHKLNTPVPMELDDSEDLGSYQPQPEFKSATPVALEETTEETTPSYVKPRGSFAESVAKETEVNQELLEPAPSRNPANQGVSRI
jgi:hypothetical protein